jgi:hypothetical protein
MHSQSLFTAFNTHAIDSSSARAGSSKHRESRPWLARISHHSSTRQLLHALLYLLHPCSRVAALCGIPRDFHSVRALNSVSTMPAHPPNNVCRFWQTLLGVVAKDTWDTTFHRLATKGGEKCGLDQKKVRLTAWLAKRLPPRHCAKHIG